MKIRPHEAGLAFGLFLGFWHAVWSLMVFLGIAQAFLDWILMLHSLANPYQVLQFDLMRSATLVVVTAIFGYLVGYIFVVIGKRVIR